MGDHIACDDNIGMAGGTTDALNCPGTEELANSRYARGNGSAGDISCRVHSEHLPPSFLETL